MPEPFDANAVVVCALPTICTSAAEVAGAHEPSPLHDAVLECAPGVRFAIWSVATLAVIGAVPKFAAPSRNCTCPATVAVDEAALNCAVNVSGCPNTAAGVLEVRLIVAADLFTTCESVAVVAGYVESPA
jgi:hypothetical protein